MIGAVNAHLEAELQLRIKSYAGTAAESLVDVVIDTGFSGFLTLPPAYVESLNLQWIASEEGILADGSVVLFNVHRAVAIWHEQERLIEVQCADAAPLIGMAMMEDHLVTIHVRPGGEVSVELDQ